MTYPACLASRVGCARRITILVLAAFSFQVANTSGQTSPAEPEEENVVLLDPFKVQGGEDEGYAADSTISGIGMSAPLKDIPIAINVITSEFLEDSLAGPMIEAFEYNSSMTQFARTGVTAKTTVNSIRGFPARYILLDGVEAGAFINPMLIDRIEVVKEPNTLYGQADPGGVVNVIVKTRATTNTPRQILFSFESSF